MNPLMPNMEDLNMDLVMEIPDTPDRLSVKKIISGECAGKENDLTFSGHEGTSDAMEEQYFDSLRGKSRHIKENGHLRKLRLPRNKSHRNGGLEQREKITDLSSPKNKSYGSKDVSLFRRPSVGNNPKHERTSTVVDQHLNKGKFIYSKGKDSSLLDQSEQNGCSQSFEMPSPHSRSTKQLAERRKEGEVPRNDDSLLHSSLTSSGMSCSKLKGKEKVDDNQCKGDVSVVGNQNGIELCGGSHAIDKMMSASNNFIVPPRVTGKKRLVRNGCISPQNIVIRSKQLGERPQTSLKDGKKNSPRDVVFSRPSTIGIADIVAGDTNCRKGKEAAIHSHTTMLNGVNMIDLSSSPLSCTLEASGTNGSRKDAEFEDRGGWISTHNHSEDVDHASGHQFTGSHSTGSQVNQHGRNAMVKGDCAPHAAPTFVLKYNSPSELSEAQNMFHTRQKNRQIPLRSQGNISSRVSDDVNITCLGSSEESNSRSSRFYNVQSQIHDSYVTRKMDSPDDFEARARQVEADEMLARELQEQLYHEVPILGNGEEEEAILAATSQNQNAQNPRSARVTRRRPQSQASQNSTQRRGQYRLPTTRMSRLANQFLNRPRAAPPSNMNFQFPLGMDLDMRLDILEALEAATGDLSDVGTASSMFHAHRDFNENDYEMLLSLDENNHQHGGASVHQINNLPQSVVQNDNFEEACAICLETPALGDTMRHLPCLHKFHKNCIDPWLNRKSSCPVCKSSIT